MWILQQNIWKEEKYNLFIEYLNRYNIDFPSSELDFVNDMISIWAPSDMFCIDIADTPDGYKIIEFGSIHNCGFYDIDLSKLIQGIQNYFKEN